MRKQESVNALTDFAHERATASNSKKRAPPRVKVREPPSEAKGSPVRV